MYPVPRVGRGDLFGIISLLALLVSGGVLTLIFPV
jgi:hypothetical protein